MMAHCRNRYDVPTSDAGEDAVSVRDATVADAAAIQRVRVAAWRAGYAGVVPEPVLKAMSTEVPEHLVHRLADPPVSCAVYVAETRGRVHGFVNCGPYRIDQDAARRDPGQGGEIYAIYVDADHWGSGSGRALMAAALSHLDGQRLSPVRLWVLADNPRARRFYEHRGFTTDGAASPYTVTDGTTLMEVRYRRT
ncbi:MAG: GNAT family N-acetyltransferase [Stackebrandtia sp.]